MVATTDGSQSTIKYERLLLPYLGPFLCINQLHRSTVHDDIQGTGFWPAAIDGRAIIGESYKDFLAGLPEHENVDKYKKANEVGDTRRKIVWA